MLLDLLSEIFRVQEQSAKKFNMFGAIKNSESFVRLRP